MKRYKYEVLISLVGGILSIIELFLDIDFGFFIISITIILDLALLGIRSLVKDSLKESNELYKYVYEISNDYWRKKAVEKYNKLKSNLQEMASGNRRIEPNMITAEELRLINKSEKSIYCTYFADNIIKLQIRLNSWAKHNPMYAINTSYKNIKSKNFDKKRIFILDKIDLKDKEVSNILKEIHKYYSDAGFDTKFILYTKMQEINIPYVGNMVLSDEIECTVCIDKTEYPKDYMENEYRLKRELSCNNIVNYQIINEYKEIFYRMWEMALDIDSILE